MYESKRNFIAIRISLIVGIASAIPLFGACTEKAPVEILDPAPGAMLEAGADVQVTLKTDDANVEVNGVRVGAKGTQTVTVDEVDGLGFIVAEVPGDPLLAVRSFHQGTYRSPTDFHPDTMAVRIGPSALGTDPASVATLSSALLTDAELESYVNDPLTMTVTVGLPVTVTVNVDSVTSPDVAVDLWFDNGVLRFSAVLTDVDVDYTATASVLSSNGTARYSEITVDGDVTVALEGVTLSNVQVTNTDPTITDSGGLPSAGVQTLANLLSDEVPPAVADAAQAAADAVFTHLVQNLRPQVGVAFDRPVTQDIRVDSLEQLTAGVLLDYSTQIQAETPQVAQADSGVLARVDSDDTVDGSAISVRVGRALVNQFAFALWDAGNFAGLTYTKAELEGMGMQELEFPYDKLNQATVSLLLPPLLEWDAEGAWLDLGGIQIDIDVAGAPNTTAWTAGRVPVDLVQQDNALRLVVDSSRDVTLREVGFDKMSKLVSANKVLRLLNTAVPGVVDTVFGSLPTIELVPSMLPRLDGSDGPTVTPTLTGVTPGTDGWLLSAELR